MFAALTLLFACTAEEKTELTVTGDAWEVTEYSAKLSGYANLPLEMGSAEFGIIYDKKQSFEEGKKILASVLDAQNMFTLTVSGLEAGTTYYYKSYVQNGAVEKYGAVKSFVTKESQCPEGAVDLGIVMTRGDGSTYKLYWAACNIGAAEPEDYGNYYAWGETTPKPEYKWTNYIFCTSGDIYENVKLSKYNTSSSNGKVDGITQLQRGEKPDETNDDVARERFGGKWRIPTDEEWTKLRTTCTWAYTTQKGVYGYKVSASNGNGNSIFLPAAGYRYEAVSYRVNIDGHYWSSSLDAEHPALARNIVFIGQGKANKNEATRCNGLSVRPVSE